MQEQHRLVGPGEEASLNFWFQPDATFPAREFQASSVHQWKPTAKTVPSTTFRMRPGHNSHLFVSAVCDSSTHWMSCSRDEV